MPHLAYRALRWWLLQGLLLLLATPALGKASSPEPLDCGKLGCKTVLPKALRFERGAGGAPYWVGHDNDGVVGWVGLSTDVLDVPGYSGKPLATLVGLSPSGHITGVRVVQHSEPILLVGIPESALERFVASYVGRSASDKVVVGKAADPGAVSIDVVSGATVTVLAENRTIMETARKLGQRVGVIAGDVGVPGHFVATEEVWSWARLMQERAFGRLTVPAEAMGLPPSDAPFLDLYFTIADAPQIGRSLLGDREYDWLKDQLKAGEHLVVVLGNGSSSFKGSGFVRGGLFDRVRLEQGLRSLMFRDRDYHNLADVRAAGAPAFKEGAVFIARGGQLDPGAKYDLVFLGSRYDQRGGFSRDFHAFRATHRLPSSVYVLDGPDPDQAVWRAAWSARRWHVLAVSAFLLIVAGIFAARRLTTSSMRGLKLLHTLTLLASFALLGLVLRAQPSVTQLFTLIDGALGSWRWGLFLSEPVLFVTWIFVALVVVIWGRGVFCGWTCPYGAFNELLFRLGRLVRLPEFELPDRAHRWLRHLRYLILAGLVGAFVYSAELGETLAEIEPFKTTFFVAPWTREWLFVAWWLALAAVALVWYRPFCRYLCPLGAALALPSSLRASGPYRRSFCKNCKICARGCEPRAIRPDGSIDPRECLSCMECEANYRDEAVCPPLIAIDRLVRKRPAEQLTPQERDKLTDLHDRARTLPPAWTARLRGAQKARRTLQQLGVVFCLLGVADHAEGARILLGRDAPSLQSAVGAAHPGDVIEVPAGDWSGPVTLDKTLILRGTGGRIVGTGQGTVIRVDAPGVVVERLRIENSGSDLGAPDACLFLTKAAAATIVRENEFDRCAFGIWVHETDSVQVLDNRVHGTRAGHRSTRGNGIHLFNASQLTVRGNHVTDGRDGIYVAATEDSLIEDNLVENTRYGVHYMYSHRNRLRSNRALRNGGGFALMQSRGIVALDNEAHDNVETGILFRDAQRCTISGNVLLRNGTGFFFYSSTENQIRGNLVRHNRIGAKIWAGSLRNDVGDNAFVGNTEQVMYVSPQDLVWGNERQGNFWSDYFGWDQDADGVGDRPYRVDSFSTHLRHKYPSSALLLQSPILELLAHLSDSLPVLKVSTVVDRRPLVRPVGDSP